MATIQFFNQFMSNVGNGNINLVADDFKVVLVNSYVYNATHDTLSDLVSSEISQGNGYFSGGLSLTNVNWGWDAVNSRTKWDADDATWNVSGGDLGPATGAVIYSDTSGDDNLVAYIDFGGSETAGDGTDFKLTFNAGGIFVVNP